MRRRSTKVLMIHVLRGWHVHLNSFKTIQDHFSSDWGLVYVYIQLLVYVHILHILSYIVYWYMSYMLSCPKHLWPWQLRDTKTSLFPAPPQKKTRWGSRCFSCRHLSKVPLVLGQDVGILRPTRVSWRGDGHDVVHLFVGLTRLKVKKLTRRRWLWLKFRKTCV